MFAPNVISWKTNTMPYTYVSYQDISSKFPRLITANTRVSDILHPKNSKFDKEVGRYLKLIEDERRKLQKKNTTSGEQ